MDFPLLKEFQDLYEEGVYIRRELHKIPEIGFQEKKTSSFIVSYLKKLGLEVQEGIAETGVVAYLPGTHGKKTYGFRADMDALPVKEQNNIPFASINEGKMHACGHDGHMTAILLLAKYLSARKEKVKENVLFIFQPAEEDPGGALPIIQEGILEKYHVEAIFGLHIHPDIEEGKIGCRPGPFMAQSGELDIEIQGKSSHGAAPQEGIDSIMIAGQLLNGIQSIISRNIDPLEGKVITIGTIQGGEKRNIISKSVFLEGTVRAFKEEVYGQLKYKLNTLIEGMSKIHNCIIQMDFRDFYPPVVNHEGLFDVLQEAVPKGYLDRVQPLMISEDFSFYQKEIPGLFFLLGSRNVEKGYIHSLHSNRFNFDEKILPIAVQVYDCLLKKLGAVE